MSEPTPREIIRLEVKEAIAAEVESYRKTMESYSANLEKAAANHAGHLQTSTRWIAGGFGMLAAAAIGVFYYFMGESVETAKNQIPTTVTKTVNDLVPGLISQEVSKLAIVNQANQQMLLRIQAERIQLEAQASNQLTVAVLDMGTNLIQKLNASATATQNDLAAKLNQRGEVLKADLIRAVDDSAKTILDNHFEERVRAALKAAVERFEDGNAFQLAVPAGTIVPYGGPATNLPMGWLLCNGDPQPRTLTNLFTAIGTSWGDGDGKNTFNVPDLRGIFLRGVDTNGVIDPDALSRTNARGRKVGAVVGSYQPDTVGNHKHDYFDGQPHDTDGSKRDYYVKGKNDAVYSYDVPRTTAENSGRETRPKNAYVHYIIKY